MIATAGELAPMIRVGEAVMVLDPRVGIVRDDLVIFEPRRHPAVPWVQAWLAEHPEWPRVATEIPR